MKRLIIIFFIFNSCTALSGQYNNRIALRLSINQLEASFCKSSGNRPIAAEIYAGLANQDINNEFDDIHGGIRVIYIWLNSSQSKITTSLGAGIYIPENNYYSATTTVYEITLEYEKYLGKHQRHSLLADLGYQYGFRHYKQKYHSDFLDITTIGHFKLSPLCISIGYGFHF